MKKCLKCGQQTKNIVPYYTAEVVSQDIVKDYYEKTITTNYTNFQAHTIGYCSECANRKPQRWLWCFILGSVMVIFCIIMGIETQEIAPALVGSLIFGPLFFISGLAFRQFELERRERIKKDEIKVNDFVPHILEMEVIGIISEDFPELDGSYGADFIRVIDSNGKLIEIMTTSKFDNLKKK